mgnify:CR=1 FL=1
MKKSILVLGLLISSMAQAAGAKYVCTQQGGGAAARTVVLTQTGDREILENRAEDFRLEVYEAGQVTATLEKDGKVLTEDVMFSFKSDDRAVSFMIYLDEMDQSSLRVRGQRTTRFTCY